MNVLNIINVLSVKDDLFEAIINAFRRMLLTLSETVYGLIIFCFNIYKKIGTAELLQEETIEILYKKVGLVLVIYMVFRLSFIAISYVLEPDNMNDKQKGTSKIITKILLVVVLLGITPSIFSFSYDFQKLITEENIIENIILMENNSEDKSQKQEMSYENIGGDLSWYLFSTFYKKNSLIINSNEQCPELTSGGIEYDLKNNRSLKYAYNCLNKKTTYNDKTYGKMETYYIDFDGVMALVAGIGLLWIIVMYTISVGYRLVQLAFLELIAPIPIMMYLEPKNEGPFQKWLKLCISCYLDYFIRTAIIYFICVLVKLTMNTDSSHFFISLGDISEIEYRYVMVILIFALLMFAKQLPEIIKKIMPNADFSFSDFGFSFKKRTDGMLGGKLVYGTSKMATFGGATAAVTGAIGFLGGRGYGRLTGLVGGAFRGVANSGKDGTLFKNMSNSIKQQNDRNRQKIDWHNNGSSWSGRMQQRVANALGFEGPAEKYENQIGNYDKKLTKLNAYSSAYKEVAGSVSKMEERATNQLDSKTFKPTQIYQRELQERRRNYKAIYQAMSNGDEKAALAEATAEYQRTKFRLNNLEKAGKGFGDPEFDKITKEWNAVDEIIKKIKNRNYTASQAESDMTDILTETRNEFITKSLQDKNGDAVIKNEATHIKDVAEHEDNKAAFSEFESGPNGTTYEDFDKFSSDSKTANTNLSRDIYETKTARDTLASSEEKKKADADRNAVGGHSGKK